MPRENDLADVARDLKRSALAVAMVMLKELDEAFPEKHGAQTVAGMLLNQKSRSSSTSDTAVVSEEHVHALLVAITATIGRLLDIADDKCSDGPLKPMLLFRIVEELAREGYDADCVLDFVRRAHAGALEPQERSSPIEVLQPAFTGRTATAGRVAGLR